MLRVIKFTTLYLILSFIIGSFFYSEYSYSLVAGTIKVVKQTDPPGFGVFDFTLDTVPPSAEENFCLSDGDTDTFLNLAPDTYLITEKTLPPGFDLVNISCVIVGGNGSTIDDTDLPNGTVTITLKADDEVTCTYLNLGNGTIIIEKQNPYC